MFLYCRTSQELRAITASSTSSTITAPSTHSAIAAPFTQRFCRPIHTQHYRGPINSQSYRGSIKSQRYRGPNLPERPCSSFGVYRRTAWTPEGGLQQKVLCTVAGSAEQNWSIGLTILY
ncbi:hypothetical protein BaRGS_00004095 [Batillaria attramentaria]|uniref:Uncharacterized protein n=1 Tax=Batillaria attramentaria TaxID=370345 RepID=A0ABD0M007_9CAEN